jgi:succinate-semialdehyde dehydrogenase / glutarate-semialdehyde dehydrogenase
MFTGINPFSFETLYNEPFDEDVAILNKIEQAHLGFKQISQLSFTAKAQILINLANYLNEHKKNLALEITQQMGKILSEAEKEIEKSISTCYWYAQQGEALLKTIKVQTEANESYYTHEPTGVILAVMPWNFPIWQILRFAIPQVMAGNAILLKPAPNVLLSALSLQKAFKEAGAPDYFFNVCQAPVQSIEKIIAHAHITGVTLTGSVRAGSSLAALAGKYIKKAVLELGGSDAFIVLPSANLQEASSWAVKARFQNAGQTCIAAKRWIVTEPVYDEFKQLVIEKTKQITIGDPQLPTTSMGPLARPDIVANLNQQLQTSLEQGAKLLLGGAYQNNLFEPTIIEATHTQNIATQQETFGPLGCLIKAVNQEQAIAIANNTNYGLAAVVFTNNENEAKICARQLQAGSVYINTMAKSHAALPFGGIKNSGFGRELGPYALTEFCNIKTVWVA